MAEYIQYVMSERLTRRLQSDTGNRSRQIHGSVTKHTGGNVPFVSHAKQMVRLILINFLLFINIFNLQYFFFL